MLLMAKYFIIVTISCVLCAERSRFGSTSVTYKVTQHSIGCKYSESAAALVQENFRILPN